jgi:hypothetical protein
VEVGALTVGSVFGDPDELGSLTDASVADGSLLPVLGSLLPELAPALDWGLLGPAVVAQA